MSAVSRERLHELLVPYLDGPVPAHHPGPAEAAAPRLIPQELTVLLDKLEIYLELLLRWSGRTNLTSVREPEQVVTRHFGESLFAARVLAPYLDAQCTVLDLGSGAGFPGLPIQLLYPDLAVMLAESQGKKVAFLREAVRALGTPAQVWAGRAEALPTASLFDAVALRAVDDPAKALREARRRTRRGGWLLHLRGANKAGTAAADSGGTGTSGEPGRHLVAIPGREGSLVELFQP